MDAVEHFNTINFNGNDLSGAVLPLAPTTGSFTGQICRDASFYPVIWNGSSWIVVSGGGVSYDYKNFQGPRISNTALFIGANSSRTAIALQNGTGIQMNTTQAASAAVCQIHVNTSIVQCRPLNVVYVAKEAMGFYDNNGNTSATRGYYLELVDALNVIIPMANASPSSQFSIIVYPGEYDLTANCTIPANLSLHFMDGSYLISTDGYRLILMGGTSISGNGYVWCKIDATAVSLTTTNIEAKQFFNVIASYTVRIKANILDNLTCIAPSDGTLPYSIRVDCLDIGNVTTAYDWTTADLLLNSINPQEIAMSNGEIGFCECGLLGNGSYYCPTETQCIMKPFNSRGLQAEVTIDSHAFTNAQLSRLTIRANKRIDDSLWMLSIGTTIATVESFTSGLLTPHTYITGLYPGENIHDNSFLTILRLSNQVEDSNKSNGYQIAHNAALILENVNSQCYQLNVFTNSALYTNSTPHCSTKNCTFVASEYNIATLNTANLRYNAHGTYGNMGRSGGTLINTGADIIVNTTHNWM